jgi:hypothetical protein
MIVPHDASVILPRKHAGSAYCDTAFWVERMEQDKRRSELYALLGDLPDRARSISAQKVSETQSGGYTVEQLALDLNGIETLPAFFVKPVGTSGPFPCVLYNHAHGGDYVSTSGCEDCGRNNFLV